MDEKTYIVVRQGSFRSFMIGALIGAGAALLLAPMTGRQTRDMLAERGTDIRDRAVDIAKNTRDQAQVVYEKARNKMDDTLKNMRQGRNQSDEVKQLKTDLEIMEDVNNPSFPL